MDNKLQPEYIFESSWEVCNLVGGIYTVLSTRAATMTSKYGDKVIFIGPDLWREKINPYFDEDKSLLKEWKAYVSKEYNLSIRIGRWKTPGKPIAVLVDFYHLLMKKNDIYSHVWMTSGVNSLMAYGDYDESSMFGYASGMIIDSYYKFFKLNSSHNVIAHFHEWMTSFGIFYLKENQPNIATIFMTHATSIGRSIAGNRKPLYDYLKEYNGDQMSEELNMVSKHSTEKQAAHLSDCFVTVSDITAIECEQLLFKKPDIVTPNGFEDNFVPKEEEFTLKRNEARELLLNVAETMLGYQMPDDVILIGTAGRYEFKNKGLDVFIESLKLLNDCECLSKQIVAFIMVPAWIEGHREDLANALLNPNKKFNNKSITTHVLHEYYQDKIIKLSEWFHLKNTKKDQVKLIFVPAYLNGDDGIFNKAYYDLLIGLDLTVFPSYYEPWGYTPLESTAFHVPTITTDLSGFGNWVSETSQSVDTGVGIIHRSDYNGHEVAENIAKMIHDFTEFDSEQIVIARESAKLISEKALWKNFFKFYEEAYNIALEKNKHINNML
ncbi:glycogen/starch synthase [Paludibacter sp.]